MSLINYGSALINNAQFEMLYLKQDLTSKDGKYTLVLRTKTAGEAEIMFDLEYEHAKDILQEFYPGKEKIQEHYNTIGFKFYKKYLSKDTNLDDIIELCQEIDKLK